MNTETRNNRTRNLQLLIEDKFGTQKSFAREFKSLVTPTDVSLMVSGKKPVSDYFTRTVESKLKLSAGWFDQDNRAFLYLPLPKHRLTGKIMRLDLLPTNRRKIARLWNQSCRQSSSAN